MKKSLKRGRLHLASEAARNLALLAVAWAIGACAPDVSAPVDGISNGLATVSALTGSATSISTDASGYAAGQPILVSFADMLGSSTDWIAIAPAGSQATDVFEWVYTGGKTSGQQSFASLGAGSYVARAFFSNSYTIAAESPAFTVAYGGAAVVSTDAGAYTATDSIVVSFSGLSGSFIDWVSIEIAGRSPTAAVVHWSFTGGGTTGTTTLPPVGVTGSYVARAYNNNVSTVVAESTPFTVTGGTTTASSDRAMYTTSTPITASYSGLLGTSTDWVALAPAGAPASSFTAWSYTGGVANGQHAFAPLAIGSYVVRVFFANSYTIAAESAPFTVANACVQPPRPTQHCAIPSGWNWCGCPDPNDSSPREWVCGVCE